MTQENDSNNWNIIIDSKLENTDRVINKIKLDADEMGFSNSRFTELQLALHEAISNAIKHGNKFVENKKVKIKWGREQSGLKISVEDEGNGFKHEDVPNPLLPENLMKEDGRGIHFIKQLSRDVRFNKKGNILTFLFTK